MSKKAEQLKGGLDALFGGVKPRTEKVEVIEEVSPSMEIEPTTPADEEDLINSVEDEALRAALHKKRMDGRGRPRKNLGTDGKRTDGYARTSVIMNEEKYAKVKEIAFRSTLTTKEVIEAALDLLIEKYEAKHGEVIPNPDAYKGDIKRLFD